MESLSFADGPRIIAFQGSDCGHLGVSVETVDLLDDNPPTLTPDQARALQRYLSGIVLPAVERVEVFDAGGMSHVEFRSWPAIVSVRGGKVIGMAHPSKLSLEASLALAACLLASADDAEGVAR